MPKTNPTRLIAAALEARKRACAPYSKFKVGAALLTAAGEIITGANVESASYGLTCCAERVALFKALTDGKTAFAAIAVVARADGGAKPCGACRQLLAEYAPQAEVWVADSRAPQSPLRFTVAELLPHAFSGSALNRGCRWAWARCARARTTTPATARSRCLPPSRIWMERS